MAKALLFSDLHCSNKYLAALPDLIIENKIKVLIFAGDVVNMGEPVWFMDKFIEMIQKIGLPFVWVPGNNDFGRAYHKLNAKYKSLEGRVVKLPPLPEGRLGGVGAENGSDNDGIPKQVRDDKPLVRRFTGVGGSPASWSGQYAGENMIDRKKIGGTIFVSHVPPPGILILQQKDLPSPIPDRHSGLDPESSDGIPKLVRDNRPHGRRFGDAPLVHICGHLHYRWGTAYLGQTKVIQLASLETGHYAIMDLETLSVDFGRIR